MRAYYVFNTLGFKLLRMVTLSLAVKRSTVRIRSFPLFIKKDF